MSLEKGHQAEITRTFRAINLVAQKNVDARYGDRFGKVITPKTGHPDFDVYAPGLFFYIEAKGVETNFQFADIKPEQRDWLSNGPPVMEDREVTRPFDVYDWASISFLWLFTGIRINGAENPRRAYLIPWAHWLAIENQAIARYGIKGLAVESPGPLHLRAASMSIKGQCGQYELDWAGDSMWYIREHHSFFDILRNARAIQAKAMGTILDAYNTQTVPA